MEEKKAEEEGNATRLVHRRRRFSAADKKRMLDEAAAPGETVSTIARKYGISSSLLFRWRKAPGRGGAGRTECRRTRGCGVRSKAAQGAGSRVAAHARQEDAGEWK